MEAPNSIESMAGEYVKVLHQGKFKQARIIAGSNRIGAHVSIPGKLHKRAFISWRYVFSLEINDPEPIQSQPREEMGLARKILNFLLSD